MRSSLLLMLVAAMIVAGCRTGIYQTADSAIVEPAVFSSEEESVSKALGSFLYGRILEEDDAFGPSMAIQHYMMASLRAPGSHTVTSRIAVEALRRADIATAISAMEESYAANTNDTLRQVDLAAVYQLGGQKEKAATLYERALSQDPTNAAVYLTLGNIYFTQQQEEKAIALFENAFEHIDDPAPITAYLYRRARQLTLKQDYNHAIRCFELVAKWMEDDRAEIGYVVSELYIAQERIREALQTLSDAIKLPKAPAAAFMRLGGLLLEQKKLAEAIRVMQSGSEKFPDMSSFPYTLGDIYMREGEFEKALQAYEDAVRIFTNKQDVAVSKESQAVQENMLFAIASSQERLKRYEDATETLQKILKQDPNNHIAMNFLAYMWAELDQNIEEAYDLSKQSLELDPENGAYLDTLGWIYFRKGKLKTSLDYLEQAQKVLGPDFETLLHFGDVYAAKGKSEKAISYWKESLLVNPSKENRAWSQLQRIGIDPEHYLNPNHNEKFSPEELSPQKELQDPQQEAHDTVSNTNETGDASHIQQDSQTGEAP